MIWLRRLLQLLLVWLTLAITLLVSGYVYLAPELPAVAALREVRMQVPLRVYSADGLLLGEFGEQKRIPVIYSQIPPLLIKAILAAEDDRFYSHHGVDFASLARAAWSLVRSGEKRQGGSTITMQVARNFYLSGEKTFVRKAKEILLALRIETGLSKEEILELYVNKIFLGHRSYGFAAAALVYYNKPLAELSLPDFALLAGLPKAPSRFNPIANLERSRQRRNHVLARLHSLKHISDEQYAAAIEAPIDVGLYSLPIELDAPYVAEMARAWALNQIGEGAYSEGYAIFTTIRGDWQHAAQSALLDGLYAIDQRHGYRGPLARLAPGADSQPSVANLAFPPSIGDLIPAVVTAVTEQAADVKMQGGGAATLDLQSMAWARPYIDQNRMGPRPQKATDVVTPGDIVLLRGQGSTWQLAQAPEIEAAIVALEPASGAIRALVGGYDFNRSRFNRVTQAERQPGSSFKPFLYASALAAGLTPATLINDAPVVFADNTVAGVWRPRNYAGEFSGPMRLRVALAKSRNLVSVRLLHLLGVDFVKGYIGRLGFPEQSLPNNLSLALGSGTLTPLQLATGFAVIANGGFRVEPFLVEHVVRQDMDVVWTATPRFACSSCAPEPADALDVDATEPDSSDERRDATASVSVKGKSEGAWPPAERVMDAASNYLLNSMLQEVIRSGTARHAQQLGRGDLGGKTGTTNDQRDAWFSGFNQALTATVWVGFDQPRSLGPNETGASAALPIWLDFMSVALRNMPERSRMQPANVVTVRIDPITGMPADAGQKGAIFEVFRDDLVPRRTAQNRNPVVRQSGEPGFQTDLF